MSTAAASRVRTLSEQPAPGVVTDGDTAPGALTLRDVTWRPAGRRHPTISHLDLRIEAGQRVLLAGASGSGKSTVLLALAGLLDPEAGDLSGTSEGPALRGLVLQRPEHAVVAETIGRDVAFGPENLALPRPEIHRRTAERLAELAPDVDARGRTLDTSGGQLQRIMIAGCLALDPPVLLLDEPISMLDAALATEVRDAVATAAQGRTVVIAEHRIEPWLDLADRLIVLGDGAQILADGVPRAVIAEHPEVIHAAGLRLPAATPAPPPEPVDAPGAPEEPPVLALHQVAVSHPDGSGRDLLQGIDLTIAPGSLVAVCGPSGCGKSTLLRAVLGLDRPSGGTLTGPDPAAVSFVPQDVEHSFVAATVAQEVVASADVPDPAVGPELLTQFGLDHLAAASPYSLSGGEQHRLAIAAALATAPRLLVLDEPTVGLDARRVETVLTAIDAARQRGCAVLAATHDEDLAAHADAVLRLGPGLRPQPPVTRARRPLLMGMNQLLALAIGMCGLVGSFGVDTVATGLLAMIPTAVLVPLTWTSLRSTLLRIGPILLGTATVAWSVALLGDAPLTSAAAWSTGGKEALRIAAMVLPGAVVLSCLDVPALGDALGGVLRLPARIVAGSIAGLSRMSAFARTWRILMETRRLRGLLRRRSIAPYASAALGMLVWAIRSATQQALAMDARGFAQAQHRTWAEPSTFGWRDVLAGVICAALLVWPWAARALT